MTRTADPRDWLSSVRHDHRRAWLWAAIVLLELYLVVAYFAFSTAEPTGDLRYLLYPFLWINAGIWAVNRVAPNPRSRRHRALGLGVAGAYLLALLAIPGLIGPGTAGTPVDLRIAMYVPGWGPLVAFDSPWLRLYLVPFEVIGYATLSYLVYANVLSLSRSALSGVLGLVTCVGCTVPILVPLVGVLGGPATSLTTTAYAWSYDIGTVAFLLTVVLLLSGSRRPGEK